MSMTKGSLQIKANKYYAVFRVNGKLKWHSLGIDAKRGNKRKAEQAMSELTAQYNESPEDFNKTALTDYIEIWLESVKPHIDIITHEGYLQCAKKHIIPYFKEKKIALQDVKIQDIEEYYNYKSTAGRLDKKPGGLSSRTIKLHSIILNLVFKKAIHDGILKSNPCEYAKIPKMAKTQPVAKFYTVEECKKLLDITQGTPLHDMIYITTIYGLRRSEMMGLKWDAVDFENDTLTIRHTVVMQNKIVAKDKTKNRTSMRTYPLLDDVKKILLKMKSEQKKNKKLFGNCYQETGYIFAKEDGTQFYPSYPTHELQKCIKKNNLSHIRWHDLRHSCASLLILKGWQMKEISEWLGHADIGTTMNIYGHLNLDHKRKLGNTLNGLLG
ncbi:MAG: site-specific integrase [Ruminococcaceae bacterium]|nr:site-specific integrase [Oscillospiraceae bacterium]